ncbi:hypothetical protein D3C86_1551830 [compost metagenome]
MVVGTVHCRFNRRCSAFTFVPAGGFRGNQRLCFFRRLTEDKLQEIRQIFAPFTRLRRAGHVAVDQSGKRDRLPLGLQFMGDQLRQRTTQRPAQQVIRALRLLRTNPLGVSLGHRQQ